jgi:lipoprotein-anchoring transpeptidase ErfK/SrfK
MRQRSFIFVAVLVAALLVGAVGAVAYDSSRGDKIAKGVTVSGVNVGGMTAAEARGEVARVLREPLRQPVAAVHAGRRFNLSAEDAGVRADVKGMVDEALNVSREGNIISRVARDLTGGEEDAQVPARIMYSRAAVRQLAKRVAAGVDRPAQDAEVEFPSLEKVDSKVGLRVDRAALVQRIEQALTVPGVNRSVKTPVTRTRPKVTRDELAKEYPVILVADRPDFKLKLYKNLRLVHTYTVAVGAVGFDTPAGLYHIQNKAVDPAWTVPHSAWAGDLAGQVIPGGTPENPLKARWLGIFDGAGIHGTDETYSLGQAASHGCIRMAIPDVIDLYPQVPVGTPIYIA